MPTSYPAGYDSLANPGTNLSSSPLHSAQHTNLNDAMEAVQAELGLSPSGSDATVAARLDRLDRLGVKARAAITTPQLSITTVADITGMSVTWTATSSRLYRITWKFLITGGVEGDIAAVYLTDASNAQADRMLHEIPKLVSGAGYVPSIGMHYATGLSGSITRKLRIERNAGSGGITVYASGAEIGFLVVEDVGAA